MAYFIIKRHCEHKNTGLRPAPGSISHLLQTLHLPRAPSLTQDRRLVYCCSKSSGSRILASHLRLHRPRNCSTSLIITPTNINIYKLLSKASKAQQLKCLCGYLMQAQFQLHHCFRKTAIFYLE